MILLQNQEYKNTPNINPRTLEVRQLRALNQNRESISPFKFKSEKHRPAFDPLKGGTSLGNRLGKNSGQPLLGFGALWGSSPQNRPQERPLKVLEMGSKSAADRRKHHKSIRRSLLHGARVPPQWLDTVATLSAGGAADSGSGALHTSSSPRDVRLFLRLTSRIYGNGAQITASCKYGTLWSHQLHPRHASTDLN